MPELDIDEMKALFANPETYLERMLLYAAEWKQKQADALEKDDLWMKRVAQGRATREQVEQIQVESLETPAILSAVAFELALRDARIASLEQTIEAILESVQPPSGHLVETTS